MVGTDTPRFSSGKREPRTAMSGRIFLLQKQHAPIPLPEPGREPNVPYECSNLLRISADERPNLYGVGAGVGAGAGVVAVVKRAV